MPLYHLKEHEVLPLAPTTFAEEGLRERDDLQRLIRDHVEVVAPDTMVIAEEYGDFEGSRRRIDLLAIDKDANLVVIELKRTETGAHMDLQALRYAAMVSTMTFEQAVVAHSQYLNSRDRTEDAADAMLEFLGWDSPDEQDFASDVRVVLASADFSKELTTAVLWLNERGLDISCVRLRPYNHEGQRLLYAEQIIPVAEAGDYQIKLRAKEQKERTAKKQRNSARGDAYLAYFQALIDELRDEHGFTTAMRGTTKSWYSFPSGVRGFRYGTNFSRDGRVRAEVYVDPGTSEENLAFFEKLRTQRDAIERELGEPLTWEALPGKRACRITLYRGGSIEDDAEALAEHRAWAIDRLLRLKRVFAPRLEALLEAR